MNLSHLTIAEAMQVESLLQVLTDHYINTGVWTWEATNTKSPSGSTRYLGVTVTVANALKDLLHHIGVERASVHSASTEGPLSIIEFAELNAYAALVSKTIREIAANHLRVTGRPMTHLMAEVSTLRAIATSVEAYNYREANIEDRTEELVELITAEGAAHLRKVITDYTVKTA